MLERVPGGGWQLSFVSVWGWTHDLQNLGIERVSIGDTFKLEAAERVVLSKRIFRSVPALGY